MDWLRFGFTVLIAGLASSLTDWIFAGVLFHDKYNAYPEVWRRASGTGETKAIVWSIMLSFFACAAFASIVILFDIVGWSHTLGLAFLVWCTGCVPVLVTNALFIKLHPLVVFSNALGWLVKLGLIAVACMLIL
jgi:hypothetical protein